MVNSPLIRLAICWGWWHWEGTLRFQLFLGSFFVEMTARWCKIRWTVKTGLSDRSQYYTTGFVFMFLPPNIRQMIQLGKCFQMDPPPGFGGEPYGSTINRSNIWCQRFEKKSNLDQKAMANTGVQWEAVDVTHTSWWKDRWRSPFLWAQPRLMGVAIAIDPF